jgi:lipopolysaccharide export system protein LptA
MAIRVVLVFILLLIPLSIGFTEEMQSPVVITSKTLSADNKEKTALFEGSVMAKRGDTTLYADIMKVYYAEEGPVSKIKKIEAEGNVRLVKKRAILTAQKAVYVIEPEENIVFTGQPRASDGENIITGSRITYFVKDERSVVEDSKVFITTGKGKGLKNQ